MFRCFEAAYDILLIPKPYVNSPCGQLPCRSWSMFSFVRLCCYGSWVALNLHAPVKGSRLNAILPDVEPESLRQL